MEWAIKNCHSSFTGFAVFIGVPRSAILEWARTHKEFGRAKEMAKDIFEEYWENFGHDGMQGKHLSFHQAAYIFNMRSRFAWNDQGPADQEDDELEFEYE